MYKPLSFRLPVLFVFATLLILGSTFALDRQPDSPKPSTDGIELTKLKDGGYHLIAKGVTVKVLADHIARQTGITIATDDELANQVVTVDETHADLESLIQSISDSNAIVFERVGDDIRLVSAFMTSQQDEIVPVPVAVESVGADDDGSEQRLVIGFKLTNLRNKSEAAKLNSDRVLAMRNALIDTTRAQRGIGIQVPEALRAGPDANWHIVQFEGKVGEAQRKMLESAGFNIGHYIPQHALAVQADASRLDTLRNLPGVFYVEAYHPYLKVSEELLGYLSGEANTDVKDKVEQGRFTILTQPHELDLSALKSVVQIETESTVDGRQMIRASASPEDIISLAQLNVVQWMEVTPTFKPMNDLGNQRMRANALKRRLPNLTGTNVVIAVTDTGIDFTHPGFALNPAFPTAIGLNSRIVNYQYRPSLTSDGFPGDTAGHGTHVAGSVFGNGFLSSTVVGAPGSKGPPYTNNSGRQFAGIAPGARAVIIEDFNSFTPAEQVAIAWSNQARIANNSWGSAEYLYSADSAVWDALVRDALPGVNGQQEFTAFFAAGNDGGGTPDGMNGIPGTIGSPANAKNVITIGAVELPRLAANLPGSRELTDSDWQVASFSSRGPVDIVDDVGFDDVRTKPDLVAPGVYVLSTQSRETNPDVLADPFDFNWDYQSANINSSSNYAFFSGTSMASPLAAGIGALYIEYYKTAFGKNPSPAMVKAALVGGARNVNTLVYTHPENPNLLTRTVDQGWGLIDAVRSIFGTGIHPTDQIIIVDQEAALQTGQFYSKQVTVNPGEGGLKIVLTWTDAAGNPGVVRQLVNDLHLLVLAPGGGGYVGNRYAANGVHSRRFTTPSALFGDPYNNVEVVLIPDATPGTYTIRAFGNDVPQGPQDFALFIMKGIGQERRFAGDHPAITTDNDSSAYVAFSGLDTASNRQVFVKQWRGDMGDLSDFGEWRRLDDNWFSLNNSASSVGISASLSESRRPSIAVSNKMVYVAWEHHEAIGTNIFVKYYNGTNWNALGMSASGLGISSNTTYTASKPVIKLDTNGYPVVAWLQQSLINRKVHVIRWNGTAWVGYLGSHTNGLGDANQAANPTLTINSSGNPVVAWEEQTTQRIHVWQWSGVAWVNLGQRGTAAYAGNPHLDAAPNGDLFLTWMQIFGAPPPYQIMAERRTGGSWVSMAGSGVNPGVTASTNFLEQFYSPNIAFTPSPTPKVFVSWLSRVGSNTSVNVKQHILGSTNWTGISGSAQYPGVSILPGSSTNVALAATPLGVPVVTFENDGAAGTREVVTYGLVSDIVPPAFSGISTAVGGTNKDVRVTWSVATDNLTVSTNMRYNIYMGTNRYPCFDVPFCSPNDVFANRIATVTNITSFTVTNLTDYEVRCFAVRAVDGADNEEKNVKILYAGPVISGIACLDRDSNTNGIPDWWEYTWFGNITGAFPNVTNVVGGLNNLDAYRYGTDPFSSDSDADELTDWSEVYVYNTRPANPDSDGDGLNDGLEISLNSNPRHFDSNRNGVSDGDMYSLGYHPTTVVEVLNRVFIETFEPTSTSRLAWAKSTPNASFPYNMWHLSTAQPIALSTNIVRENTPSTNTSFRLASDLTGTNANAFYGVGTNQLIAGLISPPINATALDNLMVTWKEFYSTEANFDFVIVQARSSVKTNWVVVRDGRSGNSDDWLVNRVDLSAYAGEAGVQIRFLFTANHINNQHTGWYIDDVVFYQGERIGGGTNGWVRNINGQPLLGAEVAAFGINVVTNPVNGHRVALPGKVFGSMLTLSDGSYVLNGLPKGRYYVKAAHPQFLTEFWNGQLMTAGGYQFGNQLNAGVFIVSNAAPGGILNLTAGGPAPAVQFELEPGDPKSYLGASSRTNQMLSLNYIYDVQGWNGSTGLAAAYVPLQTVTNAVLTFNNADYDVNPVRPNFLTQVGPGEHRIGLGTNLWRIPPAVLPAAPGEFTHVRLATNAGNGFIQVASLDGVSRPIYLNGVGTGLNSPALIKVQAGSHLVQVAKPGELLLPSKRVFVPVGARTNVAFSVNDISGGEGGMVIEAQDSRGALITNALIYINGRLLATNQIVGYTQAETPLSLSSLVEGFYPISILKAGYKNSQTTTFRVLAGETIYVRIIMDEADVDFDKVGDATEIDAFGDIFAFSGVSDPDVDGLTNLDEYELRRLYGLELDPLLADTDGDGMTDGNEIGFDGFAKLSGNLMYARTTLITNAVEGASSLRAGFVGRFLAGIWNFGTNTAVVASIDGDRFVATNIVHDAPVVPNAKSVETVMGGIPAIGLNQAISQGHTPNTRLFADTDPLLVDSDGDGMWDGFEFSYRFMTNAFTIVEQILDPIGIGGVSSDPDADGLSNYLEFLGPDGQANLADWTDPRTADTDGDTMPDGWEYFYGFNPRDAADAFEDPDNDTLVNYLEYQFGTNPRVEDTDADGLSDGLEVLVYGTNPNNPDSDGDGLFDGLEITLGTDPNNPDTDGDGMPDGFEVLDMFGNLRPPGQRLNPLDPSDADQDYDGDGLTNLQEYMVRDALFGNHPTSFPDFESVWYSRVPVGWQFPARPFAFNLPVWDYSTDPFNADTDGDGIPDGYETLNGLHPVDPVQTDYDSILVRYSPLGPFGDPDQDGLWNDLEYRIRFALDGSASANDPYGASTHPWRSDSDGDGLMDGLEHHALFANPTLQDTDGDRLVDGTGIAGRHGEVLSERRIDYDIIPCGSCTWVTASILASTYTHPSDPTAVGHLAVISDLVEQKKIQALLTGSETNIALGMASLTTNRIFNFSMTGEPFVYHNFAPEEPVFTTLPLHFVTMRGDGKWAVGTTNTVFDHFVVEYAANSVTNHYDGATNDLWELVWPLADSISRPYWQPVVIHSNSPTPPNRWGAAMVYNPAFERKARTFNGQPPQVGRYHYEAVTVLDNRKLIVIGGLDGVDRYSDIWEYSIRSNEWRRSIGNLFQPASLTPRLQGLHSGLSDFGAILFMGYFNTKANSCGCVGVPWECDGEAFGEPKNRPWNYGFKDSSYDMTYILGGWNDQNEYQLTEPMATLTYKSTDDPDPVFEVNDEDDDQSAFSANYGLVITKYSNNVPSATASYGLHGFGQLAVDDNQIPVGNYTRSYFAEENPGPERTERNLYITNAVAGIRFAKFPFVPNCDIISYAGLRLDVSRKPAPGTVFTVIAEYDEVVRTSREYIDGGQTLIDNTVRVEFHHPATRLNRPFNSSSIDTVFTNYIRDLGAGLFASDSNSSLLEIDVTTIVQELIASGNWRGEAIGFLIMETNNVADYALFRDNNSRIRANWVPSYKTPPAWLLGNRVQTENGEIPSRRKSFGIAYAHLQNRVVVFGGINGNQVLGDTYEGRIRTETDDDSDDGEDLDTGTGGPRSRVGYIPWQKITPPISPPARWGHSMVYEGERDEENAISGGGRVVMFGGFDAQNRPLNDLWEYNVESDTWTEVTVFQDGQRPSPRGGAMMAYYGGEFYKRNAGGDYRSTKRRRIVLFGGTDGKDYHNDTWVLYRDYNNFVIPDANTGNRWTLVDPGGEQSIGPSPRAFGNMVYAQNGGIPRPDPTGFGPYGINPDGRHVPASATVLLFGGRVGTLPGGPDTDRDLVPDGMEHELGGPGAGRDPRVNALVNPNDVETVPYTLKQLGAYQGAMSWLDRSHLSDLEVVSYNERNEAWRSRLFTWQGWPIDTSLENQFYVIGDETQIPFETPNTDRVAFVTGVDALSADWVNMWFHRHGEGDPRDPRDVWQLGIPQPLASNPNSAPPYARSGRWVYGTSLSSFYPNNARMELYSPIFDLKVPSVSETETNRNSYFLVFHEWLDLADANDKVRVDIVRPTTPADVYTRVTGAGKETVTVLSDRNIAHNTAGAWRRVVVPLDAVGNESNLFVRFTLQSDDEGVAGGWFIDDIIIAQGHELFGTNTIAYTNVFLLGVNGETALDDTVADGNGLFQFGFLPKGTYLIQSSSGISGPYVLPLEVLPEVVYEIVGMMGVNTISWEAIIGATYQVRYTDDLLSGVWNDLGAPIVAAANPESIMDPLPPGVTRFYRILLVSVP